MSGSRRLPARPSRTKNPVEPRQPFRNNIASHGDTPVATANIANVMGVTLTSGGDTPIRGTWRHSSAHEGMTKMGDAKTQAFATSIGGTPNAHHRSNTVTRTCRDDSSNMETLQCSRRHGHKWATPKTSACALSSGGTPTANNDPQVTQQWRHSNCTNVIPMSPSSGGTPAAPVNTPR